MKIILALGNPGLEYAKTRHNIGFQIINTLADKLNVNWRDNPKFHAITAETKIDQQKVILVKPVTFYNEAGVSACSVVNFFKSTPNKDLLVIYDDLAINFGTIRIREKGSDAGNNGIKSLNTYIGPDYTRIRIGTQNDLRGQMDDASFVLSKFSSKEQDTINKIIIPQTIKTINDFCIGKLDITSYNFDKLNR